MKGMMLTSLATSIALIPAQIIADVCTGPGKS
jgi:hypothetical protein